MDPFHSVKGARVTFANVGLLLPAQWVNITDTLPEGSPPTLAVETGFGALQFSVANYVSGADPTIDGKALEHLLYQFEDSHDFNRSASPVTWGNGSVFGLFCDYPQDDQFIRVWYCSDGRNTAFVTYVADPLASSDSIRQELTEADSIVRSLQFH
ncbi:MAG: hypothetical protein U0984_15035 [Prosthecobacter sp.]|nr:hypothetical protein [Prosthecobacter sp.]